MAKLYEESETGKLEEERNMYAWKGQDTLMCYVAARTRILHRTSVLMVVGTTTSPGQPLLGSSCSFWRYEQLRIHISTPEVRVIW